MTDDVPGKIKLPDPSLGGAPQVEGPTTHRHGVTRPAVQATDRSIRRAGKSGEPDRLAHGLATVPWRPLNSLLAFDLPQLPVEGVRDPEGFAFTAVSPFY